MGANGKTATLTVTYTAASGRPAPAGGFHIAITLDGTAIYPGIGLNRGLFGGSVTTLTAGSVRVSSFPFTMK